MAFDHACLLLVYLLNMAFEVAHMSRTYGVPYAKKNKDIVIFRACVQFGKKKKERLIALCHLSLATL